MSQSFGSDTELLASVARGDEAAVRALYTRYHHILVKWICAKGASEEDAQDIFQDALLIVYEKSKDPEFCLTCRLGTYIFSICKNIWLKKRMDDKKMLPLIDDSNATTSLGAEETDVAVFYRDEARYKQLEKSLASLGTPCANLLKAFYVDMKSMKDIAEQFNYTNPDNAKTQKYKCLKRLRKLFLAEIADQKLH